ncbi:hypothetical protein CTEN210_12222 [Chaetoceros tenuissimus]|uniref:Uncharacterized protein n=1 Tax=Chaetoceros tenuissimus TaxID=426638 RepID=A0AAD3D2T9_9STRA|nr:hypothetical protein CTEN210_12222 [Chaetoceros tenuissimus]
MSKASSILKLTLWLISIIIAVNYGSNNTYRQSIFLQELKEMKSSDSAAIPAEPCPTLHQKKANNDDDEGGTRRSEEHLHELGPQVVDEKETESKNTGNNFDSPNIQEIKSEEIKESQCPSFLQHMMRPLHGYKQATPSFIWSMLQDVIVNATVSYPSNIMKNIEEKEYMLYKDYISTLYQYYTVDKLRRSIANPPHSKQIIELFQKINDVQKHNQEHKDKKVIRIVVLGGSVTAGHEVFLPKWLVDTKREKAVDDIPHKELAWPNRLEQLLNHIFFQGEAIFQVENISSGGQTSEFGALVLQHALYEHPERIPDIIISAYSANEALDPNRNENVFYEYMQNFVNAARNLHPCKDYSPLVILADDFFGDSPYKALQQTGYVYKISTWYQIMAINYSNVVRYKVLPESNDGQEHPLTSARFTTHLGLAFHIGMSWVVGFNLLNQFMEVCNDMEHIPAASMTQNLEEESMQLLFGEKYTLLQQEEPPPKFIGQIGRGRPDNVGTVSSQYIKNKEMNRDQCQTNDLQSAVDYNPKQCEYGWIVHQLPRNLTTKEQLAIEMNNIVTENRGWEADGDPIVNPRTGWYANEANATFTLQLNNIGLDINFVLVYSMKSYGPKFKDSKIRVTTNVTSSREETIKSEEANLFHDVDGFHETRSSIHYPHKIPISDGGAKVGDSLTFKAELIGGNHFKIAGLAFCK